MKNPFITVNVERHSDESIEADNLGRTYKQYKHLLSIHHCKINVYDITAYHACDGNKEVEVKVKCDCFTVVCSFEYFDKLVTDKYKELSVMDVGVN